ncbi:MAG: type II toxin-antitoxin system VapC family toxin [Gammaproteobacteria bacterium]|nr:type II toxin-antitoxin system VapC family toxin [Gammaproteobacteria bacterium]
MTLVLDASVVLKWFFRDRGDEAHADNALAILYALDAGTVRLLEPPHFVAEMAAVLARENPDGALDDLVNLEALDWRLTAEQGIYATAVELSASLGHHLFDTLYHATALHEPGATLVTADERYYKKAKVIGRIVLLHRLELPGR